LYDVIYEPPSSGAFQAINALVPTKVVVGAYGIPGA